MSSETRAEAALRIERAQRKVEQAQRLLGEAAADISGVVGAAMEWRRIGKLCDGARAAWGRLAALLRRGRCDLDGTAKAALERRGLL